MLNKNQIILVIVSLVTFSLSGFLFYKGLEKDFFSKFSEQSQIIQPTNQVLKSENPATQSAVLGQSQEKFKVSKVVDGDTIEVLMNGEKVTVRLIGINTPETVDPRRPVECFGREASKEAKRLLEGKEVTLENDVSGFDKYQRALKYVYLPLSDGSMLFVNDYLVRQGYANSYPYPPDVKYQDRLNSAEKEARENSRGLWDVCK